MEEEKVGGTMANIKEWVEKNGKFLAVSYISNIPWFLIKLSTWVEEETTQHDH